MYFNQEQLLSFITTDLCWVFEHCSTHILLTVLIYYWSRKTEVARCLSGISLRRVFFFFLVVLFCFCLVIFFSKSLFWKVFKSLNRQGYYNRKKIQSPVGWLRCRRVSNRFFSLFVVELLFRIWVIKQTSQYRAVKIDVKQTLRALFFFSFFF